MNSELDKRPAVLGMEVGDDVQLKESTEESSDVIERKQLINNLVNRRTFNTKEEMKDAIAKILIINDYDSELNEYELDIINNTIKTQNDDAVHLANRRNKLIVYVAKKNTDYATALSEVYDSLSNNNLITNLSDDEVSLLTNNLKEIEVVTEPEPKTVSEPVVKKEADSNVVTGNNINYKPEISELSEKDPVSKYILFSETLAGPNGLKDKFKNILDFENNLIKDEDGNITYRNDDEESVHDLIRSYLAVTTPVIDMEGNIAFSKFLNDERITQSPTYNGKSLGPKLLKNDLSGIMKIISSRSNANIPSMIYLPATGILIKARAPTETEICNFDIEFTLETSAIGMSSYGLLLSASSGVYLKHMLNHALNFITSATIDVGDNNLKQVLYNVIDARDYWLVLMAPLIAKYPGGFPWYTACTDETCGHYNLAKINIARCIRYADYKLNKKQLDIVERQTQRESIGSKLLAEYRDGHEVSSKAAYTDDELKVTVNFKSCTLSEYIDSTESWITTINNSTAEAMSTKATELEREQHLKLCAENNRLIRYKHSVKNIVVVDDDGVPVVYDSDKDISDFLLNMSSNNVYTVNFERAHNEFQEDSRLAIFGYMAFPCPKCGKVSSDNPDGKFRGIVPISPDRLFYSLSRVVCATQRWTMKQLENAG